MSRKNDEGVEIIVERLVRRGSMYMVYTVPKDTDKYTHLSIGDVRIRKDFFSKISPTNILFLALMLKSAKFPSLPSFVGNSKFLKQLTNYQNYQKARVFVAKVKAHRAQKSG